MAAKDRRIGVALAAATCTLLGSGKAAPAQAADDVNAWDFETALLYYGENDSRVRDISLSALAKRLFEDEKHLDLSLSVDTLTGASPSGAIATGSVQTFTSPSGREVYSTPANEIPLDDTFLDTRVAVSAHWTQSFARLYTGSAGASFSTEYDYTHIGADLALSRDFKQRNTTVSAAVAFSQDDIDPVGGAPQALSQMLDVGDLTNRGGSQSKDVLDVLIGMTQVINRTTLLRINYSFSDSSGYLTDPYKFLSVVDPISGDTLARSPPPGTQGPDGLYRFENRPDSRTKHGLFLEGKHAFGSKVLDLSYRYMTDDWEIDSHTLDARLRWPLGSFGYVEPHVRYYSQTAADFYRVNLTAAEPLPQFVSADSRLGDFDAITVGVKFGREMRHGAEWSARIELYQQNANVPDALLIGNQFGRERSLDLNAIIAQISYRFGL
jgi:hypothetical protein